MPTYRFKNNDTGEEFEKFMSISARDTYLEENPHIQSMFSGAPGIGDPIRLGRGDQGGFRDVLRNIHRRNPGSKMNV
jgi:hypothetical protein